MQSQRNMCQSTLCQALGQCWRAKTTGERKMTDKRRRRDCNIFLNTSVRPKPHPLSGKPFLASQCQMSTCPNVRCRGGGRGGFTRSPCLFNFARAKPSDRNKCWRKLSKLTNHRVYQEMAYRNKKCIKKWTSTNEYWPWMDGMKMNASWKVKSSCAFRETWQ